MPWRRAPGAYERILRSQPSRPVRGARAWRPCPRSASERPASSDEVANDRSAARRDELREERSRLARETDLQLRFGTLSGDGLHDAVAELAVVDGVALFVFHLVVRGQWRLRDPAARDL